MYYTEDELAHFGIQGMKWGIRRFQNKDGTRTPAGLKRERDGESSNPRGSSGSTGSSGGSRGFNIDKKTVMTGAAIAGAVALGAVLVTNPGARNVVAKYGSTAMVNIGTATGKGAAKFANKLSERASKVGDAMIDAALISVGTVAVSKVAKRLAVGDDATEAEKFRSKVMTDVATAGINTAITGKAPNGSSSNSGNKGGSVGKEVTEKIGSPSKKGVDKQSPEYQELFKGQDADTRATIKKLAGAGYDIDQINKYLGHADFEDWASQYFAVEIGW